MVPNTAVPKRTTTIGTPLSCFKGPPSPSPITPLIFCSSPRSVPSCLPASTSRFFFQSPTRARSNCLFFPSSLDFTAPHFLGASRFFFKAQPPLGTALFISFPRHPCSLDFRGLFSSEPLDLCPTPFSPTNQPALFRGPPIHRASGFCFSKPHTNSELLSFFLPPGIPCRFVVHLKMDQLTQIFL